MNNYEKIELEAKNGCAEAQYKLSQLKFVKGETEGYLHWLFESASRGHAVALSEYDYIIQVLKIGKYKVENKKQKAADKEKLEEEKIKRIEKEKQKLAEKQEMECKKALYREGQACAVKGNYKKAVECFEKSGLSIGCYQIGCLYLSETTALIIDAESADHATRGRLAGEYLAKALQGGILKAGSEIAKIHTQERYKQSQLERLKEIYKDDAEKIDNAFDEKSRNELIFCNAFVETMKEFNLKA